MNHQKWKVAQSLLPSSYKEYCFVHVRRTDYLCHPEYHPVCSEQYYKSALEKIPKDVHIVVFSDDIHYAERMSCFSPYFGNITFMDHSDVVETFFMMCQCQHAIIANSSLSLLGLLFQYHNGRNVYCAPSVWFGSRGPPFDHQQVMPIQDLNISIISC